MARLLSLLLIAVALTLPTVARTSVQTAAQIEPPAAFVQSATSFNAKRMAMTCPGCKAKACGADAIACGGHCAAANALSSLKIVLAAIASEAADASVITAVRDHHGPPDPYPPRSIVIS